MLQSILTINLMAHFGPSFRDAILNARRRECGKTHVSPSSPRAVPPLPLTVTPPSAICTSALQSVAGPAVLLLASARFEGRSRRAAGRGSRVPARPAPLRPGRLSRPRGCDRPHRPSGGSRARVRHFRSTSASPRKHREIPPRLTRDSITHPAASAESLRQFPSLPGSTNPSPERIDGSGPPEGCVCGRWPRCGRGARTAAVGTPAGRRARGAGPGWRGGMRSSIVQAWPWRLSSPPPWLPVSLLLSSQ